MDYNKEMVENKNDQNPKGEQQLIEIGEASTIWTFKSPVESDDSKHIEQSVREAGKSRFGWSNKDHHNLTKSTNKDRADNENLGVTAFLLRIKKGDWIVHINCPSHGKCLAVKVLSGYKWDDKSTYGDFRHYFEIDKNNIIAFHRNNTLIPKTVKLSLRKKQWRIFAKEDFEKAMNSIIQSNGSNLNQPQEPINETTSYFAKKLKDDDGNVIVTSVDGFIRELSDSTKNTDSFIDKNLYRGLSNSSWKIQSTDQIRFEKLANEYQHDILDFSFSNPQHYNSSLIQYFKHEFSDLYKDSHILNYELAVLAQLRHYDAATALIDFSGNPLISLWFACQPNKEEIKSGKKINGNELFYKKDTNGVVHVLNIEDEEQFIKIGNNEQLKEYTIDKIYGKENLDKWFYWKPSHLNKRIPAQSSYFVIGANNIPTNKVNKIIIPHENKKDILDELKRIHSIDSLTVFPDMHGFATTNAINSPYSTDIELQDMLISSHSYKIELVKRSNTNDKELSELYSNRALTKFRFHLFNEAIDDFNKAIEFDSTNYLLHTAKGYIQYTLKQYEESINSCRLAIKNNPEYAPAYGIRGMARNELGEYTEALKDHDKAIEINPKYATFYNSRGVTKAKLATAGLGKHNEAIKDFDKAIELDPLTVLSYTNRGRAHIALSMFEEAIEDFDKAIKLNPEHYEAYILVGIAKMELDKYDDSLKAFDKAIEINPNIADAYEQRGEAKMEFNRRKEKNFIPSIYEEAIEYFDKAITLHSKNKFDQIIITNSRKTALYYNLGLAKYHLERYEEAIADFNKALEIGTMNKEPQETLDKIKKGLDESKKAWAEQKNKNKK